MRHDISDLSSPCNQQPVLAEILLEEGAGRRGSQHSMRATRAGTARRSQLYDHHSMPCRDARALPSEAVCLTLTLSSATVQANE